MDNCKNKPESSSATKIGEHIPCGYSVSTVWAFDNMENKHDLYRGEDFVFLWENMQPYLILKRKRCYR